MSCSYNLHCVTCKSTDSVVTGDFNHGGEALAIVARHAAAFAAIHRLLAPYETEVAARKVWQLSTSLRICDSDYEGRLNLAWFAQHEGHLILPIDEYGHIYDECAKPIDCKERRDRTWCRRTRGHDGACASKRDAT